MHTMLLQQGVYVNWLNIDVCIKLPIFCVGYNQLLIIADLIVSEVILLC